MGCRPSVDFCGYWQRARQLERELGQQQANLAHLDATMRFFDPDIRPNTIRPRQQRARSVWFRPGECLRLIYDELRDAVRPMTTRELAERIMRVKAMPIADDRQRCQEAHNLFRVFAAI
jgi:hypothetical protein